MVNFKVLATISEIPLMTPFIFPLVTHNNFQKEIPLSQIGCRGGAKTFGASSRSILRLCVHSVRTYNCKAIKLRVEFEQTDRGQLDATITEAMERYVNNGQRT